MKRIVLFATMLFFSLSGWADDPKTRTFSETVMHYFENPSDTIVDATVDYFRDVTTLDQHQTNIRLAFFSVLFKDANLKNKILEGIAGTGNEKVIGFFKVISETDVDSYFVEKYFSPELNDMLWAAYFASGNEKYLAVLLSCAATLDSGDTNMLRFLTDSTAAWSLSQNALQFPSVKKFLEHERVTSTSPIVARLLDEQPSVFNVEMAKHLKEMKDSGKW